MQVAQGSSRRRPTFPLRSQMAMSEAIVKIDECRCCLMDGKLKRREVGGPGLRL